MEACVEDIRVWYSSNKLKLNDNKTEIIHFSSRFSKTIPIQSISIGESSITTSSVARDLGVMLDSNLTMSNHVNSICKKASLAIRQIGQIRKYLDNSSTEKLVHAFITSRLDYCNAVLYGLPKKKLQKLQRVQNTAARLVVRCRKYEHISPVLLKLHWLPVKKRVDYKILLTVYKAVNNHCPSYITELLSLKKEVTLSALQP